MKFILKNPDLTTNEQKPYIVRFPEELYVPLSDLTDVDPLTDKPILISNYQKDMLTPCYRTFWIVSYLPVSVIRWLVENLDGLTHYAFCTHDRDYTNDGELKKAHTHLLLYFNELVSGSFVAAFFHTVEVKAISRIDISSEWNYLIHDSLACRKQRKHIYNTDERFTDDEFYWNSRCTCRSSNTYWEELFMDFYKFKLTVPELLRKYGYEIIRSVKNLQILCDMYHDQQSKTFDKACEELPSEDNLL